MASPEKTENKCEIMISYSWNCKKSLVDRLYQFLTSKGYSVWKDDEGGMKGNLVDDMAHAVRYHIMLCNMYYKYYHRSKVLI